MITKEIHNAGTTAEIVREYTYDQFGNRVIINKSGYGFEARSSEVEYDTYGRFPVKNINELGHISLTENHPDLGLPVEITTANGIKTQTFYNAFGVILVQIDASGLVSKYTLKLCENDVICKAGTTTNKEYVSITTESSDGSYVTDFYDAFGRIIRRQHPTLDGKLRTTTAEYYRTLLRSVVEPATDEEPAVTTNYKYDSLGRVVEVEKVTEENTLDGNTTMVSKVVYNGLETTHINPKGQSVTYTSDSHENLTSVTDNDGNSIKYVYTDVSKPARIELPTHNVTMKYDENGRMIESNDPNEGTRKMTLNGLSEAVMTENALGQKTCYAYDKLGRMVLRTDDYQGSSEDALDACDKDESLTNRTEWLYDTKVIGQLTKVYSPEFEKHMDYDRNSRLQSVAYKIHENLFQVGYEYDAIGRMSAISYPNGFKVFKRYGEYGQQVAIQGEDGKVYWKANKQDGYGNISSFTMGNGITTKIRHNRLRTMLAEVSFESAKEDKPFDFKLVYDMANNIKSRTWIKDSNEISTEQFTYDSLNRLTGIDYGQNNLNESLSYSALGNILNKSNVGDYLYEEKDECGNATVGPNAVTSVNGQSYCYDANGNLVKNGDREIKYTSF